MHIYALHCVHIRRRYLRSGERPTHAVGLKRANSSKILPPQVHMYVAQLIHNSNVTAPGAAN
eukprot:8390744-Pyramimonas_sp.AAC.2